MDKGFVSIKQRSFLSFLLRRSEESTKERIYVSDAALNNNNNFIPHASQYKISIQLTPF